MVNLLIVIAISFTPSKNGKFLQPRATDDVADRSVRVYPKRIKDFGDSLYGFNAQLATGDNEILGVEFVGGYFWLSGGNSMANPNKLYKLDRNGVLEATYDQPTTSSWGFRDLASDGQYIYGTDDDGTIYQIDITDGSPTGVTIPGPLSVNRALAYDPSHDRFWTANFRSQIYEFDRNGNVFNVYPNDHVVYGMAWDDVSPGGPWLWVATQDYNGTTYNVIYQFDPRTGTYTDSAIVVNYGFPGGHAGGLAFASNLIQGKAVLIEVIQETDATGPHNDIVIAIEVADFGGYNTPMPPSSITSYSDYTMPSSMILRWNDPTHYVNGTRLRNFHIEVFTIDSQFIASVESGVESTIVTGLTDGVQYQFLLQTVDSADQRSMMVPSPWWYAGGSPWPAPPENLRWHYIDDSTVTITWDDPTTQSDGTPLDDLLGVYIYLDGELCDSTYAGFERRTIHVVPGPHYVYLRAFDAEPERHISIPSDTIWIFTTGHRVGPDDFGYHIIDSYIEDSLQFSWTEVADYGTRLDLDDDDLTPVELPFIFPFYDTMFTTIYVNSNGGITFDPSDTLSSDNQSIPSIDMPMSILPLWSDLNPADATDGGVFVAQAGSDFIVEWKNVPIYGTNMRLTFEIAIHPNGWIEYRYLSIPEDPSLNYTVGVFRSYSPFYYLQYSHNGEPISVTDSLAVEVIRPPFHDLGVGMVTPSDTTIWPGIPVVPHASIVNFSENPESVDVTMRITLNGTPVFCDTVSAYVEPYASSDVTFGHWIPSPDCQGCSYTLEAQIIQEDSNMANNSSSGMVQTAVVRNDSVDVPLAIVVPVIDGQITEQEWGDAQVLDLSDVDSVLVYLKHDDANLYIAVDAVTDTTVNTSDRFEFFVDDNGDRLWPVSESDTSEGGNAVSVAWQWATRPMTFDRFYDWGYPRNDMIGNFFISLNSGHFQAELRVPLYLSEPDPAHITPAGDSSFNILLAYVNNGEITGFWPRPIETEYMDYPIFYGHLHLMPYNPGINESAGGHPEFDVRVAASPSPIPMLEITAPKAATAEIILLDASGRVVHRMERRLNSGANAVRVETPGAGVYFVVVRAFSERRTAKIISLREIKKGGPSARPSLPTSCIPRLSPKIFPAR